MYTDRELVLLYRQWSEETWAAGFMRASEDTVREFIQWLKVELEKPVETYESDMIRLFRTLEREGDP